MDAVGSAAAKILLHLRNPAGVVVTSFQLLIEFNALQETNKSG
jgi:hypothetical protein